jgi:hypothetical protein
MRSEQQPAAYEPDRPLAHGQEQPGKQAVLNGAADVTGAADGSLQGRY